MMEDVGLDDVRLIKISTIDLNRHLKKKGIGKDRQNEVKQRRRKLKNRFASRFNSRAKFAQLFSTFVVKNGGIGLLEYRHFLSIFFFHSPTPGD